MPKAEVGSTKYLANKMRQKGLQRLRWYCQACERQMRDENGFKQHAMSEGHVRTMQLIGEDPNKYIREFSNQFKRDFLQLLRTSHGEKPVHLNKFYMEYISNKEHIRMNSTHWTSLHMFAKDLGREGITRITEDDKGVYIAWIDNSPDALRRQDAIRKKERQDRGDEEREQKAIQEQVERAQLSAKAEEDDDERRMLERKDGEKITLNFGGKPKDETPMESKLTAGDASTPKDVSEVPVEPDGTTPKHDGASDSTAAAPVKISFGSGAPKAKNVFAAAKKNSLASNKAQVRAQPKKMSEAERIMREELDRKRPRDQQSGGGKKMKFTF